VDEVLSAALAPVLRDLRSTGATLPRIEDRDWTEDPDLASAMLWSAGGSGMGVYVPRWLSAPEAVEWVADKVQEWAIEDRWGTAPTNWPPCPHHPSTHPLTVSSHDGRPVWACPADGTVISPVGDLQPIHQRGAGRRRRR
jgi:hypothetical protein